MMGRGWLGRLAGEAVTFDETDAANDSQASRTLARDRASWMVVQRDEAQALREQQASAGAGHGPVSGPGPYGDHGVNMAVERAVKAERDRCVAITLAWAERCESTGRPVEAGLARALARSLAADAGEQSAGRTEPPQ
jgi:hypothetical protein